MACGGCASRRTVREHIGPMIRDDLGTRAEGSRMKRIRAAHVAARAGRAAVGNTAQVRSVAIGVRASRVPVRIHIGAMYRID